MEENPSNVIGNENRVSPRKSIGKTLAWLLIVVLGIVVLLGLLLPTHRSASEASRRMQCLSKLRQVGLAILIYEAQYHEFPPAYTVDENGKRLHSWRTLILPYIGRNDLYSKIDLSKAWDDPVHDAVRREKVSIFQCPTNDPLVPVGNTTYMVVVDANSCFRPGKSIALKDIIDRESETLLVCEADVTQSVPLMSPQDLDLNTVLAFSKNSKTAHPGGRQIVFVDGSGRFCSIANAPDFVRAAMTINGNDSFYKDSDE